MPTLNIVLREDEWRRIRRYAESHRTNVRASCTALIRLALEEFWARRETQEASPDTR